MSTSLPPAIFIARHTRNIAAMRVAAEDKSLVHFVAANNCLPRDLWRCLVANRLATVTAIELVRGAFKLAHDDLTYVLGHETRKLVLTAAVLGAGPHIDDPVLEMLLTKTPKRSRGGVLDAAFISVGELAKNLSTDLLRQSSKLSPIARNAYLVHRATDTEVIQELASSPEPSMSIDTRLRLIAERPGILQAFESFPIHVVNSIAASRHLLEARVQQAIAPWPMAGDKSSHVALLTLQRLSENPTLHPEVAGELLNRWQNGVAGTTLARLRNAADGTSPRLTGSLEAERDPLVLRRCATRTASNLRRASVSQIEAAYDLVPLLGNSHVPDDVALTLAAAVPEAIAVTWSSGRNAYAPYVSAAEAFCSRFPDQRHRLLPKGFGIQSAGAVNKEAVDPAWIDEQFCSTDRTQHDTGAFRQLQFIEDAIGENEHAWRVLLSLADTFAGTVGELVAVTESLCQTHP